MSSAPVSIGYDHNVVTVSGETLHGVSAVSIQKLKIRGQSA